jgi:small subunit ribosomal protein S3
VPLHTLRANIDYGFAEAATLYGKLGIKCWICKGENKPSKEKVAPPPALPIGPAATLPTVPAATTPAVPAEPATN